MIKCERCKGRGYIIVKLTNKRMIFDCFFCKGEGFVKILEIIDKRRINKTKLRALG